MSTEGRFHLYSIRADGRGLTQLTDEDASDLAPDWSPDRMLAFQSNREDGEDVFVADPALAAVEQISDEDRDGEPAWAPDGKQIALVRNDDLYLVRPHSGRAHRVALDARWPTWAPGGSLIAYETDRDDRGRIVVVAPGVGGRAPLVVQGDNRAPAWSPRGDRIAYECRRGDHWHICLLEPDRGRRRLLTPGDDDEFAPAWSPDGRRIAFIGDRDGNDQLYVMRADGSEIVRLTSGQADKEAPAWRP
jgi:TolB protein